MTKSLLASSLVALSSLSYGGSAVANDFPTQARVEYVLSCMGEHGGQSYDTLYACVCIIDKIADRMPYREYTAAETLSFLFSTPGERGGVFRDAAPQSRKRIKALRALREEAKSGCLVSGVASSSVD